MRYDNITPARFLSRPNRFIARVELEGGEETVHVKNTGRCRELLVPGTTVWLTESGNPVRKTRYDLVAVDKGGTLINMNILSEKVLMEAHEDPSTHPDLVVRVTGYSAFFNTLTKDYRQQVIDRFLSRKK